jgi:hypothetical protein
MEFRIKETGELKTLEYTGGKSYNGIDYLAEISSEDDNIVYDRENSINICDQYTFEWWVDWVRDQNEADARIDALTEIYGYEKVQAAYMYDIACELEDQPHAIMVALDEVFGDEGKESGN